MKLSLNGKKLSKKEAELILSKTKLNELINNAKETYKFDPYIETSFLTAKGTLNIEFEVK